MPAGFSNAARRLVSPQATAQFQSRVAEFAGLMLGIAGIALGLALCTYSPADPSFDTATIGPVRNVAGHPGADIADILFQWFGLAGVLPVACLLAWAWRIASRRGLGSVTLRLTALFAALPASAAVLACMPALIGLGAAFPSAAGPGGAVGDTIAGSALAAGRGLAGPFGSGLVWLIGLAFAVLLTTLALGLSAAEWRRMAGGLAAAARVPFSRGRRSAESRTARGVRRDRFAERSIAPNPATGLEIAPVSGRMPSPPALLDDQLDEARDSARALLAREQPAIGGRVARTSRWQRATGRRGRAPRQDDDLPPIALPPPADAAAPRRAPAADEDPPARDRRREAAEAGGGEAAPRSRLAALPGVGRLLAARRDEVEERSRRAEGSEPDREDQAGPRPFRADRRPEPQGWRFPPLSLLHASPSSQGFGPSREALEANARLLETVLADYGVQGVIRDIRTGPVVSLYELEPAPGIRSARVIGLADDIARSLSVTAVRIATVPGRNVIGIEIPNAKRETVFLAELLGSDQFRSNGSRLVLALGKDIGGAPILADLARMPHLLIAGTTGSGKSVGVNAMIASLLYRLSPDECRIIMIDPKMLELSVYDGIPHLMAPVVTEPKKAVTALKWTVREMERRYRLMSQLGVRNIGGYNDKAAEARARGEDLSRRVQTGFDGETGKPVFEEQRIDLRPMPFLVVVIDEMADLMMVAGKEIETAVQRLAQMARAAGIHVIMATQRPSVDVITGVIKANFPTRISFQVISKFDSRTILGEQGAEQLLGQGDMLLMQGGGRITRVHGPFVDDREVEEIVAFLKTQGTPDYVDEVTDVDEEDTTAQSTGPNQGNLLDETSLFDQAVALVAREGKASTSFIQRHLSIGYNRAAKLIEQMEKEGIVGPANHVGKREILVRRASEMDVD